ncbi:helix-turn-helix transcriptional regulator [Eggerthella sinensis]|uniref:helix-turn-helix transcriptional regulator n=1 Tax=Eggerthella sinensis TaxID=242230 RepID=UPI003A4E0C48
MPSIAKKLFISENTVRTHTKKVYALLDVHSKQEIVDLVNERTVTPEEDAL